MLRKISVALQSSRWLAPPPQPLLLLARLVRRAPLPPTCRLGCCNRRHEARLTPSSLTSTPSTTTTTFMAQPSSEVGLGAFKYDLTHAPCCCTGLDRSLTSCIGLYQMLLCVPLLADDFEGEDSPLQFLAFWGIGWFWMRQNLGNCCCGNGGN